MDWFLRDRDLRHEGVKEEELNGMNIRKSNDIRKLTK